MPCVSKGELMAVVAKVELLQKQYDAMQETLARLTEAMEGMKELHQPIVEIRDAVQAMAWLVKALKYLSGLAAAVGTIYAAATGKIAGLIGV